MKKLTWALLALFFILLMLLTPGSSQVCKNALTLFLTNVAPVLLPFFIASSILSSTGVIPIVGAVLSPLSRFLFGCGGESSYIFVLSALCGYPLGAKLTQSAVERGTLSACEAKRTVILSSVTSLLFIAGVACSSLLNASYIAPYVLCSHYLSAIILCIISRFFTKGSHAKDISVKQAVITFRNLTIPRAGEVVNSAVFSALKSLGVVGGCVIFFYVTCALLGEPKNISGILAVGSVEMTTGISFAGQIKNAEALSSVASFIISFGGLSIIFQTAALQRVLKMGELLLAKAAHGSLAALLSLVLTALIPMTATTSTPISSGAFPYIGCALLLISLFLFPASRLFCRLAARHRS